MTGALPFIRGRGRVRFWAGGGRGLEAAASEDRSMLVSGEDFMVLSWSEELLDNR